MLTWNRRESTPLSAAPRAPMFTILEISTKEQQLSILKTLFMKKNTNRDNVSKSNPILKCLLISFSGHQKKTPLPVLTQLTYNNLYSNCFSSPLLEFPLVTTPCLLPLVQNRLSLTILSREVTERKGHLVKDFNSFL